jgi:hypothetical protein
VEWGREYVCRTFWPGVTRIPPSSGGRHSWRGVRELMRASAAPRARACGAAKQEGQAVSKRRAERQRHVRLHEPRGRARGEEDVCAAPHSALCAARHKPQPKAVLVVRGGTPVLLPSHRFPSQVLCGEHVLGPAAEAGTDALVLGVFELCGFKSRHGRAGRCAPGLARKGGGGSVPLVGGLAAAERRRCQDTARAVRSSATKIWGLGPFFTPCKKTSRCITGKIIDLISLFDPAQSDTVTTSRGCRRAPAALAPAARFARTSARARRAATLGWN